MAPLLDVVHAVWVASSFSFLSFVHAVILTAPAFLMYLTSSVTGLFATPVGMGLSFGFAVVTTAFFLLKTLPTFVRNLKSSWILIRAREPLRRVKAILKLIKDEKELALTLAAIAVVLVLLVRRIRARKALTKEQRAKVLEKAKKTGQNITMIDEKTVKGEAHDLALDANLTFWVSGLCLVFGLGNMGAAFTGATHVFNLIERSFELYKSIVNGEDIDWKYYIRRSLFSCLAVAFTMLLVDMILRGKTAFSALPMNLVHAANGFTKSDEDTSAVVVAPASSAAAAVVSSPIDYSLGPAAEKFKLDLGAGIGESVGTAVAKAMLPVLQKIDNVAVGLENKALDSVVNSVTKGDKKANKAFKKLTVAVNEQLTAESILASEAGKSAAKPETTNPPKTQTSKVAYSVTFLKWWKNHFPDAPIQKVAPKVVKDVAKEKGFKGPIVKKSEPVGQSHFSPSSYDEGVLWERLQQDFTDYSQNDEQDEPNRSGDNYFYSEEFLKQLGIAAGGKEYSGTNTAWDEDQEEMDFDIPYNQFVEKYYKDGTIPESLFNQTQTPVNSMAAIARPVYDREDYEKNRGLAKVVANCTDLGDVFLWTYHMHTLNPNVTFLTVDYRGQSFLLDPTQRLGDVCWMAKPQKTRQIKVASFIPGNQLQIWAHATVSPGEPSVLHNASGAGLVDCKYTFPTKAGDSGSPLWDPAQVAVVAIHFGQTGEFNSGWPIADVVKAFRVVLTKN